MEEQVETGSSSHSNPIPSAPNLNTKEGVAEEMKKWMERTENDQEGKENPKSYDNAVSYIETLLNRQLSTWETTWIERQYVTTLLKLWLENSLGKAFEYLEDETNNISEEMSTLLGQLDSINSFNDILSKLNDVTSPLKNLSDGGCRYLQLIIGQTDLIRNTSCYTFYVNCYFKQFKTSCTNKLFSRCIGDIVKDERNEEKNGNFITKLNEFLVFINEDKNLIEKLVEQFVTCSKNDFLNKIKKTEKLKLILDKDVEENTINIENVTESDWQGIFHRLVSKISQSFIEANGNQVAESTIPDWFTHSEKVSSLLNDVEWTPKLQILIKEICKKFLLPETEIKFMEEDGKGIISIKGVVIFVSLFIDEMKELKEKHPEVEEIKIVGLKSVHIDCDLDNDTWNGTNIGIVTDKLIVDDVINEESSGFCWNVSGKNAIPDLPRGERRQPGESGGNVLIICNEIINGQNWTIVSDGGDGSSALKWTREEFKKSFPSMSTGDKGKAIETVLTTLNEILPIRKRMRGEDVLPGHNFLIQSQSDDGSEITATFYKGKNGKQTLILIQGCRVGQGGYGGDIAIECFATSEGNETPAMPLTGKDSRPWTAVRLGVYEASGRNGKIGKGTGDVGFIEKGADGSQEFYGFEKDENIEIELDVKKEKLKKDDLYVKYKNHKKEILYAKLAHSNSDLQSRVSRESAVKKKSVIRQSLVLHLDEIDERNRLTKSIEKMLSNPMEHKLDTIDEIINEMGDKVHQLHQRTTQRQQHQKIEQEKYVRPSTYKQVGCGKEDTIMWEKDLRYHSEKYKKKVEEWMTIDEKLLKEKIGEYVNLLLELKYKKKWKLLDSFTENSAEAIKYLVGNTNPKENFKSRNVEDIIAEMKKADTENNKKFDKIKKIVTESKKNSNRTEMAEKNENISEILKKILKKAKKKSGDDFEICKINGEFYENHPNDPIRPSGKSLKIEDFLCVFGYAIELEMGFKLRDTQRVAIVTLLAGERTLVQVSTGEGKSIIVAGVAIGFALLNKEKGRNAQIDVITSNDVLAIRDSSLSFADGGLKELYDLFNVTVANNCSKFIDDRKRAYNMDVVYGTLANFERDHLLDKFYNYNIRGDRMMMFVIIDEVDCMLLDRGSNILYLSHDIPGMEMLESLYLLIWENIKEKKEWIKSAILFDLYGQITEGHLNFIHAPLGQGEFKGERTAIWDHLIGKKVIDKNGRLLVNDVKEITEEKIKYEPMNESLKGKQLNPKIVFYLHSIVQRERRIRIPSHLLPFVDRHLDTWLDNARRALELKQDEDYVIDHNRSETSPDLSPQVIIIDPDTGTDQSSSQWDGALHQFLQLKEGCKLTLQTLKVVFISNITYVRMYGNLVGVSGTLGSPQEQAFLKKFIFPFNLFTIPTAFPKRFSLKPPKLFPTEQSWRVAVTEETRWIIGKNRSIVIFCRSIKEVNKIYKHLSSAIPVLRDNKNKRIHRYTRDYEKFEFESKELDEGHVIVATNLAGRGTDIKISDKLKSNGGLHICLTYFPENERVEDQAMGRAARKGEPGSGILILCSEPISDEWEVEKNFFMIAERDLQEEKRILRLEKEFDHIKRIEILFNIFTQHFRNFKEDIETKKKEKSSENDILKLLSEELFRKFIQGNALDKWALWLDETDNQLKTEEFFDEKNYEFTIDSDLTSEFLTTSTPARRIEIAKHLATIKIKEKHKVDAKEKSIDIFNELINSTDKFFYPAAFYYRAFIFLTELKGKNKNFEEEKPGLIRLLRIAETILNEQINMQISFIQIHQSINRKSEKTPSFCAIDGYKEQKKNNIEILQYFIGSIQWMLGSRCSISDLRDAASKPPKFSGMGANFLKKAEKFIENKKTKTSEELKKHQIRLEKADDYFNELIESKGIVCELNNPNTIPINDVDLEKAITFNRSELILKVSDDYGVSASLEDKLKSVFHKALNEEKIEQELKNTNLIPCTRTTFWTKLIEEKALNLTKELKTTDCVIISEAQLKDFPKLEINKAITLEFGIKSFANNHLYVLYNPRYESRQELETAGKVMFSKEYVKKKLLDEYPKREEDFESNKIAQLDLDKLKDVNLESFGRLCLDDLSDKNISQSERIWNQLVQQNIIDGRGHLVPNFDIATDFSYPECPAYEEVVMCLVGKKFVAELVRQQWLKVNKENPNCLKAINLLPRNPYRDMLADLMVAHVISGARVTEHFAINLKEEVDKITECDQERECLMEFLTSRQSVFTKKPKAHEFFLDFIERDLKFKFSSELHVFRLAGFDQVIDIRDPKWTFKSFFVAGLCIFGGLASIGGGVALNYLSLLSFGLSKNLFFMGGLSDILYAFDTILSRKDFTWADYGRQRIRSAMGKTEPIDAIKATWKLSNSSNKMYKDSAITNVHVWEKPEDQNKKSTNTGTTLGIQNLVG